MNRPLRNSGIEKLTPIGLDQVEVETGAEWRVSRRALGQKEHRVLLADRVRIVYLVKKFSRIGELGLEGRKNLFSNRVAAGTDAWADGGNEVFGVCVEFEPHLADPGLDNPAHRTAPASVEGCDDALFPIRYQDWNAVSGLDGKKSAGLRGHKPIALAWIA